MVRRIPIRAKVAGALTVPLLGLVAAAGIGVTANTEQARRVTRQAELATASIGHTGLIGALQNERNLALAEMLGLGDVLELEVRDMPTARQHTDQAGATLLDSIAGQDDARRSSYADAIDSLAELPALRARADAATGRSRARNREAAHAVFADYTVMVSALFASHDRFALGVDDAVLRQGDDLVRHAAHATDSAAQLVERLLYLGSGPGGIDKAVEVAQVAELRRDIDRVNAEIEAGATGPYADAAVDLVADPKVTGLPALAREAIATGGPVDTAPLAAATPLGPGDGYVTFRDEVVDVLDAESSRLRDEAEARRRMFVGAASVLVAVAVLIAWSISRSITRPLRELSVKARSMATYRLPAAVQVILDAPAGEDLVVPEAEPIAVRARDEVADVVRALNDVQESALGLAVEQAALRRNIAESYVNLGRRNQNLLSRLLTAVGDLERDESDPARLRKLYRLDHLATRIRRNAESLLVLSRADAPSGWQPPVAITGVVRAALGEVESYERVLVGTLDPVMIIGGASADVAHLLAELVENGLRHSPPRELVEVSGRATDDGYAINIVDHGLGMTPEDIERANHRLAGTESFTVTPAKYLGHYVTAVLAARHGIKVRLKGSVVVGIAALVELPGSLITEGAEATPWEAAPEDAAPEDAAPDVAALVDAAPDPAAPEDAVPETVEAGPIDHVARGATPVHGDRSHQPDQSDPADTPSRAEVRDALIRLRSGAAPPRPRVDEPSPEPGAAPLRLSPDEVMPPSAGAPSTGPERTASGLVRRVRGAHVPLGVAAARQDDSYGPRLRDVTDARAVPDAASSTEVDGAEMQRFLTSLVEGVQRSLDEQGSTQAAGDER